MADDPDTEGLRSEQVRRFRRERREAEESLDETEAEQHARRAERAEYLAGKLEERAATERDQ